ncbi:MAG TPA: hypothetical protein PK417_05710 [Hyphomonas sp.]|nr:hypothetical protein [Hyphomonas sp.]HRX73627.1 hypothetical protein [Hyphomonas sp.]
MGKMKFSLAILALCVLPACASLDNRDRYLLGEATRTNIAEQSIRDVSVPNSEHNQSASGVRAANAVRALNEGKRKELAPSAVSGAGESL